MKKSTIVSLIILSFLSGSVRLDAQTIALWLFDEQIELYPSCVLSDAGPNDYPMVLGQGGQIVPGKFGNGLEPVPQQTIEYPRESARFGLAELPIPEDRTIEPMTWKNALFCGLFTSGENHLRKEIRFPHVTEARLNLGDFDWTVEFWYKQVRKSDQDGVIFEVGQGPRGENEKVTRLVVLSDGSGFQLTNEPGNIDLVIPTKKNVLDPQKSQWHHFTFVYDSSEKRLHHFVDGIRQTSLEKCSFSALSPGEEDYFSVGRDGLWKRALPGAIDELRFSKGQVYTKDFQPPGSFSPDQWRPITLKSGLPLLFNQEIPPDRIIPLGSRKHLFIDDRLVSEMENITFQVNPPRLAGCVIDSIKGAFRKHLSVVEDDDGLLRLYYGGEDDYLAVMTSRDGVKWEAPDLGLAKFAGEGNYVIKESSAMGNMLIDPNGPPEARWKYVSGFQDRGVFVFYSPDGWQFNRVKTAAIPVRSGSQSNVFYDEQQHCYMTYHRSDFGKTVGGKTERRFGFLKVNDLMQPWPFYPVSQKETREAAKIKRLREPQPWYLDNGPLTPGGLGIEYPLVFGPDDEKDPEGTDMYVPKAIKYPWAPDTYLAFPLMYLHYEGDGSLNRQILAHPDWRRGSGPIETQLAVSRNGVDWKRFNRPAYVGIGRFGDHDIFQSYLAHGLIRRGEEIWQYSFSESRYHSSWLDDGEYTRAVYRFVQRLDGFVSADTPYEKDGLLVTRPFTFNGNRLVLNIDTDAVGYAQVGFLDARGKSVPGFSVDNCVIINGDFIETEVEWIENPGEVTIPHGNSIEDVMEDVKKLKFTKNVSSLEGKTVQLVFRMRGTKLYAMQFIKK